jgi:Arc/MetJ family transcription regulator
MRTNIDIDDSLMAQAMALSGASTKKEAVEKALRLMVGNDRRANALKELQDIGWEGDLEKLRTGQP